ncbi:MAG: dockerin type I repeat-containing protein [Eubacteriales bacterium]|nr:dockerin type I repeat-containing protein [Eubacteriales bacterium]
MYKNNPFRSRLSKMVACFLILQTVLILAAVPSVFSEDTQTLPYIHVFPMEEVVAFATNGTPGLECSIRVYDSDNNLKFEGNFEYSPDNPQYGGFPEGLQIDPGDRIELSSGELTRSVTVTELSVSEVNIQTDTVTGTSNDPSPVHVKIFDEELENIRYSEIEEGGWIVDFSEATSDYDAYDLTSLDFGVAVQTDEDGDCTAIRWRSEHLPNLHVFPSGKYVGFSGNGTPGLYCTLTLYDSSDVVKFEDTFIYMPNMQYVGLPVDLSIDPGDRFELSSGYLTRELIVTALNVTEVDIKTDIIVGTSDTSIPVWITVFFDGGQNNRSAIVIDGVWTADFKIAEGSNSAYDLTAADQGIAVQSDEDGDCIIVSWRAPNPELVILPDKDFMFGSEWKANSTVNISVYANGIDFLSYQAAVDPAGYFEKDFSALGVDLHGGQKVTVSDGMTDRECIISSIRVIAIDIEKDLIYGDIEPDAYVQIIIMTDEGPIFFYPIADADGLWIADLSVPYIDDGGNSNPAFDIVNNTQGAVRNYDGHGNATICEWTASDYSVILGDVNNDSKVDTKDVTIILKYLAGKLELTELQLIAADYNQDGNIDKNDTKLILKQLSKKNQR